MSNMKHVWITCGMLLDLNLDCDNPVKVTYRGSRFGPILVMLTVGGLLLGGARLAGLRPWIAIRFGVRA